MSIKYESPYVAALKKSVESEFGRPIKTPTDFVLVADRIKTKTRQHISESTIKRLWTPSLAYKTVSSNTLNVLSIYVGYKHFQDFQQRLSEQGFMESELIYGEECIKAKDLNIGDKVYIAWLPDRECTLEYLGNRQFKAIETLNSTIQAGDTFFCSQFIRGRKLYVDNLEHNGQVYDSYGIGIEHGLTRASLTK